MTSSPSLFFKKNLKKTKTSKGYLFSFLLLSPLFIWMFSRTIYPLIEALRLTFFELKLAEGGFVYVGTYNWLYLFKDENLPTILVNTIFFSGSTVIFGILLSLGIALVLNEDFKGKTILKAVLIVPWAIPGIVTGLIWQWIFSAEYGIVNGILLKLNLISSRIYWFQDPLLSMTICIIGTVWQSAPFLSLMLWAALQMIPQHLYDAAKVDGASAFQRFLNITLPGIKLPLFFAVILHTINSFKAFDIIYKLTKGGPGIATKVLYYYTWETGFVAWSLGYATVLGVIVFVICFILTLFYLRSFRPKFEAA